MLGVLDTHTLDALTAKAVMALNGLVSLKLSLIAEIETSRPQVEPDRLSTAKEVAKRLGVSCVWVTTERTYRLRYGWVQHGDSQRVASPNSFGS